MRRAILGASVGLDVHDPSDAAGDAVIAHEEGPQQAARRLVDRTGEEAAQLPGRRQEYLSAMSDGTIQPKSAKKRGISDVRKRSTTCEPL